MPVGVILKHIRGIPEFHGRAFAVWVDAAGDCRGMTRILIANDHDVVRSGLQTLF